jgi:hypothetical protein
MGEDFWTTTIERYYILQWRKDCFDGRRYTIAAKEARRCTHAVSGLGRFGIGVCGTDNVDRFPVHFINFCDYEKHIYQAVMPLQ